MIHRLLYTGWGAVIGLVGFICVLLTQLIVDAAMHDDTFYSTHDWPKMLGLGIAAAISLPIGHIMNRRREHRAGDTSRYTNEHSLFFIPVQYWWIVYLVIAGVIALV